MRSEKKLGRGYWPFSLSSLHLTPTLLVFGALAPAGAVMLQDEAPPLNVGDLVACVVTLAFLVLEAVADETLRRHRASGAKTTCVRGPWAWSRHPNYLGECGFWSGIYLLARAAGIGDLSYAAGPVALWLFFRFASAPLMEERSRARRRDGLRPRVAVRGARAAAFSLQEGEATRENVSNNTTQCVGSSNRDLRRRRRAASEARHALAPQLVRVLRAADRSRGPLRRAAARRTRRRP